MTNVELRPMGVGDILDVALRLYRARFMTFLLIVLVVYVPFAALSAGWATYIQGQALQESQRRSQLLQQAPAFRGGEAAADNAEAESDEFAMRGEVSRIESDQGTPAVFIAMLIGGGLMMMLMGVVVIPLCNGAMVHNISAAYLGEELGAWESYRRAAPRLMRLLWANILAGVVIMLGFLLLIVPGIIFSLWFMLVSVVVMLEAAGGSKALGRSRELMRGNLGKGFLIGLVVLLLTWIVSAVLGFVVALIPWPHPIFAQFFNTLSSALIVPIQIAPATLLYYDLRIRKEGFDLQRLAEAMGTSPVTA